LFTPYSKCILNFNFCSISQNHNSKVSNVNFNTST
jgi:hypothetical protein